ncbi:MAG: bifunctional 2-methylcitrate synthase/citrate synthase [Salinibacter sp.]
MTSQPQVQKGLKGVLADQTAVSDVLPKDKKLFYRGYPVDELAERCRFEEVAYLLLHGELPGASALSAFEDAERAARGLGDAVGEALALMRTDASPMDVLRTGVSLEGSNHPEVFGADPDTIREHAGRVLAQLPTLIAANHRRRHDKDPIPPRSDLSVAANFFHMCFGSVPDDEVVEAFDTSLILYAEHGFNASTFTSRVITSTLSDYYGAVAGAIAALKGTLHGGANEAVMEMLLEIDAADADPAPWVRDRLDQGEMIMGFGHRIYKYGDSRVPIMRQCLRDVAGPEQRKWIEIAETVEETMQEETGIPPNLDYPAGPAYYAMGFEIELFTPIFVMSRVTGWSAHILEQLADNTLIRPSAAYVGPEARSVPPIDERPDAASA